MATFAFADPANALIRLLNSRASGSPKGYAEAAAEVAGKAAEPNANPLYGYVLATVSLEKDAPAEARLDDETRRKYFDASRDKLFKLAKEKDNPLAWYLLSLESHDTNMLCHAAEKGNVQALNAWGAYLIATAAGNAMTTNEISAVMQKAYGYFNRAAGMGDANGLYNLGMCYAKGYGVEVDDQQAFNCFRSAAEKGHPEAINNIGWFFREGRVVPRDLALSAAWFAKSAGYRNIYGMFNYAVALENGEGVKKDVVLAASLMKHAADGGCIEAVNAYGVMLGKGNGVKQDHVAAFRLFLRAAQAGYPPAMENLATCYETGRGVKADEALSMEWKIRSKAARGDRNAIQWLRSKGRR